MMKLADTSAWAWSRRAGAGAVRVRFDEAVIAGDVATCDMVRLELLESVRNAEEFRARREELAVLPDCPIGTSQWRRALWVYERLAEQGGAHQRAMKHADLLVAAAAEAAGLPVVHYDEDFDRIAAFTGQPVHWLAERGSL
jgi:predicted nucleic acid-binding protein